MNTSKGIHFESSVAVSLLLLGKEVFKSANFVNVLWFSESYH